MAGWQIAQMDRPYLYPLQPLNLMSNCGAHPSDLPFSAFVYSYSEATAIGIVFPIHNRRRGHTILQHYSTAQLIQRLIGGISRDISQVDFIHMVLGVRQSVRQITVVRYYEEPFSILIETAHRIDALTRMWEKIHDSLTAAQIDRC